MSDKETVTCADASAGVRSDRKPTLVRDLSLLDSVLLLMGGIVGSSVFLTPKDVAAVLPNPLLFVAIWLIGGLITLFACFAFAEMAAMFPESGGQYVFLREAYGDFIAFLYGWMIFSVSNTGTIAALAAASAAYLGSIFLTLGNQHTLFSLAGIRVTRAHGIALGLIAFVTWTNVVGLRRGHEDDVHPSDVRHLVVFDVPRRRHPFDGKNRGRFHWSRLRGG